MDSGRIIKFAVDTRRLARLAHSRALSLFHLISPQGSEITWGKKASLRKFQVYFLFKIKFLDDFVTKNPHTENTIN